MRYSYWKGSLRSTKYENKRNLMINQLNFTELIQMIFYSLNLISIYESSFDKSILVADYWLPKGENHSTINNRFKGRGWLILATWNDRNNLEF